MLHTLRSSSSLSAAGCCHPHPTLVRAACRPALQPIVCASKATSEHSASVCRSAASSACSRSSSRTVRMVCRDAPRPMWAAKQPKQEPGLQGSTLERFITSNIKECTSITDLGDVCSEWGGSFNPIHAAAALVKYVNLLKRDRRASDSRLLQRLVQLWLNQSAQARLRACANVLWACAGLGDSQFVQQLWGPTWEAYVTNLERDSAVEGACPPQELSNLLWASAKLCKQPAVGELQLLLRTFLQQEALGAAKPQAVGNVIWALGELSRLPGWEGGVSEQDIQQLLGKQQMQSIAGDSSQCVAATLVGLARLATTARIVGAAQARDCCQWLLATAPVPVERWQPQELANSLWAVGELGCQEAPVVDFVGAVVAAAPHWVPKANDLQVPQFLRACAQLGCKDEVFLLMLLEQGRLLLQVPGSSRGVGRKRPLSPQEKDALAALCSAPVVQLDMPQLADPMRAIIVCSGIGQRPNTRPSNLWKLWIFHNWLLRRQLLDGKGLTAVLSQRQLQQGEKDAARRLKHYS